MTIKLYSLATYWALHFDYLSHFLNQQRNNYFSSIHLLIWYQLLTLKFISKKWAWLDSNPRPLDHEEIIWPPSHSNVRITMITETPGRWYFSWICGWKLFLFNIMMGFLQLVLIVTTTHSSPWLESWFCDLRVYFWIWKVIWTPVSVLKEDSEDYF